MSQHRDEAIKALKQVRARLAGTEPIEGFARFQLTAAVEFALEELAHVQEVKRVRRPKATDGSPEKPAEAP